MTDHLNGWTASGALSLIGSALVFIWRTHRQADGNPNSLIKRIARWASATGRVPLVEDALSYTTDYNESLLAQRAQWISERRWFEGEVARLTAERDRVTAELNALRSSPDRDSSPDSNAGSTGSAGVSRRKRRMPGS